MLRAALCLLAALLPAPALSGAAQGTCDTALLLAIDVSNSVDDAEYRLQIDGLADALRDPEVTRALVEGQVALAVVQWSGPEDQRVSVPWQSILAPADATILSARVRALPRAFIGSGTSPAEVIRLALSLLAQAPACARQVIDVSGDGIRNEGEQVTGARDAARASGVTINAIAIETTGRGIAQFFAEQLITPDGFLMSARGHRGYHEAIRQKILRELAAPVG